MTAKPRHTCNTTGGGAWLQYFCLSAGDNVGNTPRTLFAPEKVCQSRIVTPVSGHSKERISWAILGLKLSSKDDSAANARFISLPGPATGLRDLSHDHPPFAKSA